MYLQCLEPGWAYYGYWTAGQRLYASDCSTGFVWKPDNQTVTGISSDSWVTSDGWMPGQPDCAWIYAAPNSYENCMNLPVDSTGRTGGTTYILQPAAVSHLRD